MHRTLWVKKLFYFHEMNCTQANITEKFTTSIENEKVVTET